MADNILNTEICQTNLFNNLELFTNRFPDFSKAMNFNKQSVEELVKQIPENYILQESKQKNGDMPIFTACINGKFIHSKYKPTAEAEKVFNSEFFQEESTKQSCVFFGLGLGYLVELYARQNPNARLIIVEPDIFIFLFFLASRDLRYFFKHENLSIILGAYPSDVLEFLNEPEQSDLPIFRQASLIEVSSAWFGEFETLKKRKNEQNNLNRNTLKKFGKSWLKNVFKNLDNIEKLKGIVELKNSFKNEKAIVLGAGPSLSEHLNIIKNIADKFIIIATDTAVRACLREGLIPDFILLLDSQYWNYLHLSDLNIEQSILITEAAVYPAVFRLKSKQTILCTSSFPLAQYIEEQSGNKGKLVTGGSVATASWDFARTLGCSEIIMAGLDLAFPNFQTHFVGSRFEENSNSTADRLVPTEMSSHKALYSAMPEIAEGYENKVFTDKRMKMYAWWFESKIEEFKNIRTYNLLPQGLKIPNMPPISKNDLLEKSKESRLSKQMKEKIIYEKLQSKADHSEKGKNKNLKISLNNLSKDLSVIAEKTARAIELEKLLIKLTSENKNNTVKIKSANRELIQIDEELKNNKANKIIGFNLLLSENNSSKTSSLEIYKNIHDAVSGVLKILGSTKS